MKTINSTMPRWAALTIATAWAMLPLALFVVVIYIIAAVMGAVLSITLGQILFTGVVFAAGYAIGKGV